MSRRRTNSNSVSLFPFLAVLLCAMGALLFLLIVATRMIRDEAVQKNAVVSEPIPDAVELPLRAERDDEPPAMLTAEDIVLGVAEQFPEPDHPLVAPKPKIIIHKPDPLPDLSAQIAKLRAEQKSLDASRQALENAIEKQKSLQANGIALQAEIDLRQKVLNKADAAMREMRQSLESNAVELSILKTRRAQLEQTLKSLTRDLQVTKSQPRSVTNPLKIVPYEGKRGTTRRPLILECRENSIVFLPEGVELTEKDLLGFTTQVNPLLSGVRALDHYWTIHDGQQGLSRRPYVLIVVRPDGIAAYYALRQLLTEYDQPFGYELLDDKQSLALEAADSKATQVLNASVKQVLARRTEFATSGESVFALPKQHTSNPPSERNLAKNRIQPAESGLPANSKQPRFRMTPRGLEFISPDEEPEDSRFPSPPQTGSSSSPSNGNVAERSRPSSSNPPIPLKSLGKSESKAIPRPDTDKPATSRPPQGLSEKTTQKQNSALSFPELLDLEPIEGDRPSTASSAPLLPTNPLLSNSGGSSSARKGKGPSQPVVSDGKIHFQRDLTVVLGPNELRVGYGEPIEFAEGISTRELLTLVVNQLRDETSAWGSPPGHLAWKPVVRFVLQPGGYQHYERMRPYFERHKLVSSVSFEFDQDIHNE